MVPFAEGDVRAMWIAGQGWAVADGTRGVSKNYIGVRPLLTLDPESDDDAHRVIRAFWAHHNDDCDDVQAMRDALRSLVAPPEPPKPAEPTGLGAVVEDDKGGLFVRTADVDCFKPWSYANSFSDHDYANITAVRILSDGVS
jgi:hypothetical protein